jgi:thioesterase domain-containing protein
MAAAFLNPAELAHPAEVYPLQPLGSGLPFFLVTPGLEARAIAKRLGPDRPIFGLRVPNLEHMAPPHSMERLAAECVRALRRFRPSGPYALGGWCSAGVIALEMARQLEEAGERVALVMLLDARGVLLPPMAPARRSLVRAVRLIGKLRYRLTRSGRIRWMLGLLAAHRERFVDDRQRKRAGQPKPHGVAGVMALRQYRPRPWSGRMLHLWAAERPRGKFLDPAFRVESPVAQRL